MGRKWIMPLFIVILALFLTACGARPSTDGGERTLRIGFQVIPNTEAVAKAKGWHEQTMAGTKIEWMQFDSGRDVNTAMASGSIDIGLVGTTLAASGISSGLDYEVIWIADVIGANEGLVVKQDSGIETIADLKGKKIAVTFGSTTQYALLGALKAHNVAERDLQILDMQPNDMLAAWKRGDIDGGYVWHPTLQEMKDDGGRMLTDSGKLIDHGIVTADVIVVRKAFAKENPDLVQAYIRSQIKAVELYRENPEDAALAVGKLFAISQEKARAMMDEQIWLTAADHLSAKYLGRSQQIGEFANVLADTGRFLQNQGVMKNVSGAEVFQAAVNPKYVEEAMNQGDKP